MPAKRLPWFRFWIDATTHGKVRQLDDATFRTWVEMLDAAAKQPRRGRFESRVEAISILRRPPKHIATLITAKLVDEVDKELVMHDWDEWQRWRAEDANDDATPPDHPPNGRANDSRTTREEHRNGSAIRVSAEGDTETEKELLPSLRSGEPRLRVVGEPAPKPTPKATPVGMLIDKVRTLDPSLEIFGDRGFVGSKLKENPDANLDLIAEAYVSFHHGEWPGSKMLRESGALAWVIGDLGGYVAWRKSRRQSHQSAVDRTGVAN